MKVILIILNIFALIASILWLISKPDFEPFIVMVGLIVTLIGQIVINKKQQSNNTIVMNQKSGNDSTNYQAANDINITNNDKR